MTLSPARSAEYALADVMAQARKLSGLAHGLDVAQQGDEVAKAAAAAEAALALLEAAVVAARAALDRVEEGA